MITVVSAFTEAPSATAYLSRVPATGAFTGLPPAEAAGAGAVVLKSIFEEQIEGEVSKLRQGENLRWKLFRELGPRGRNCGTLSVRGRISCSGRGRSEELF